MPDITRHTQLSRKLDYEDLDWNLAREAGLSDREKVILPYFADIEGQTVFYMLELLKLKASRAPDIAGFVTLWNYEEYYHSLAIAKLLAVCGYPLERDRLMRVRVSARFRARFEDGFQMVMSRLLPESFVCLWMTWGASQELLTLKGYEQIARSTHNPVLRELCLRIAKQERRHFSFYFNSARERLARSPFSQRVVRFVFERFWTPVGVGVKSKHDVAALIANLFPGDLLTRTVAAIDAKMGRLSGLEGTAAASRYAADIQKLLERPARSAAPVAQALERSERPAASMPAFASTPAALTPAPLPPAPAPRPKPPGRAQPRRPPRGGRRRGAAPRQTS